jgi:quercetin dioxygenase-like cupin family protein
MKAVSIIAFLFAFAVAFTASASAQTPPGVAVRFTSTFENIQPPARHFNLLHGVSEFRPGEAARSNSTDGHRFFTTIEGELTVVIGDKAQKFKTGEKWHVPSGIYFGIKNEGSATARVFFSVLAPIGGRGAQPVPGSEVPAMPSRIVHLVQTPVTVSTNTITVVQVVQDWPAGARNSNHAMNQPHLFSMMEGENTSHFFHGHSLRIGANEAGGMDVGHGGYMQNTGAVSNRLFFTWAATPGQPNTVPASPPAAAGAAPTGSAPTAMIRAPSAGDGGLLGSGIDRGYAWFYVAGGIALISVVTLFCLWRLEPRSHR